jgi:DNA polymerase-3 subunit epsilon
MTYEFVALDVETANSSRASICQIGIVSFSNGKIKSKKSWLINPEENFDDRNIEIHGIKPEDVIDKGTFLNLYEEIKTYIENSFIVHHGSFDRTAFARVYEKYELDVIESKWIDNTRVVRNTWDKFKSKGYGLKNLTEYFDIELEHHDALSDAFAAGKIAILAFEESGKGLDEWYRFKNTRIKGYQLSSGEVNADGPFYGQTLLFTGTGHLRRQDLAERANALGFKVVNSPSKKVDILSVGDLDYSVLKGLNKTSKHIKMEELIDKGHSAEIITDADLQAIFDIESA